MDIHLLSAYLPRDRRHALATGQPLPDRATGAMLLADIAGFTPLADALTATLGPRRGAEELTQLLNAVYDALIAPVHHYGGCVVSFVGDALVCWFDGTAALRAVACAQAMQRAMAPLATVQTPDGGPHALSMKVGLAAGPVRCLVVGDPQVQRLGLLAGATLDRMAQAEQVARPGEVVVGPEIVHELGDRLAVAERREGFGIVGARAVDVPPAPWPALPPTALRAEQLRPYLLTPVYERLVAGQGEFLAELRPAVALFLRFQGLDYERDDAGPRLDAFVRWVQQVLTRYGGVLLQLTAGDKGSFLYAAFGALTAHEDDAARAVSAALALRQLPPELDFITGVQIGLSRGRVRAGAYGSQTRRAYGAIGPEAVVACRLMEHAPAGAIWCSPAVRQTAGERWVFEALPAVALKGKPEPLPVYQPLRPVQGRRGRAAGALIGRQAEVGALTRLLGEAQAGQRRVLLLEGEAGIGKSRLVGELRHLAQQHEVTWLEGTGQSIEQGTPYRAWRDVLAAHLGLDESLNRAAQQHRVRERVTKTLGPAAAQRAPLLNDVLRLDLPETDLTQSFDPQLRHESLTALVVDLLHAATAEEPLVPRRAHAVSGAAPCGCGLCVVLEDAHWLDSLSWELALAVARALFDQPLLLVLALRPLEDPQPAAYAALVSLEGAEPLRLEALPPDQAVTLAAARLGVTPEALPAPVADLVRERAGGNPFFAEELAYVLRDSGVLVVDGPRCTLVGDVAALREQVPDTVEGVVLARIDRLPLAVQLTLKVAAVIGRSFLYRALRDVHPRQVVADLLRAQLDELEQREITLPEALEPELSYLFKHVITQQVAYDTLLFSQRRELHQAVAGWYERVYAEALSPYYPLLVHHWHRAEDAEQERRYARLAGEQAAAQYANAEAVGYLSRALELTPEKDLQQRYALLLAREKVYDLLGRREVQAQDLAALEELAQALDDERRVEVVLRQANYGDAVGDFPAAIKAAQQTIQSSQTAHDPRSEAEGRRMLGRVLFRQGDPQAAHSQFERALALAQKASARSVEALSLQGLGIICRLQGRYVEARQYQERALDIGRETGDRRVEGNALVSLGLVFREQGDYAGAKACYEQARRIWRELGHRWGEGAVLNNIANILRVQRDLGAARTCYEEALRISREYGDRLHESYVLNNLGSVFRAQGNYAWAIKYDTQGLHIRQQVCTRKGEANSHGSLGKDLRCLGDYANARSHIEQALSIFRENGERWGEALALADLGLLFHHLGDDEVALEYGRQALHLWQALDNLAEQVETLITIGRAQMGLGNLAEAATAFQQARDLVQESKHYLTMEPIVGLASAALAQGDPDLAQTQVAKILTDLESNFPDGSYDPFWVYLTCYQVLETSSDPRASEVLTTVHGLLQEQAAEIDDEALRRSFLENVVANREIVAAYRRAYRAMDVKRET